MKTTLFVSAFLAGCAMFAPGVRAAGLTIGGTSIVPGGPAAIVETPLTEKTLQKFGRRPAAVRPNKLKMAIQLPAGFDPMRPQRVLWVSGAINNDQERSAGNCRAIGSYAKTATDAGWIVIAADTELGNPRAEDNIKGDEADKAVHLQAVETLVAAAPEAKSWQFACGGFSGGAKATFFRVGELIAANLNVIGMFVGGCNQDMTRTSWEEVNYNMPRLRKVRVFLSNGKADNVSTVAMAQTVKAGLDRNFGKVELHLNEGGHNLDQAELKKALDWFAQP